MTTRRGVFSNYSFLSWINQGSFFLILFLFPSSDSIHIHRNRDVDLGWWGEFQGSPAICTRTYREDSGGDQGISNCRINLDLDNGLIRSSRRIIFATRLDYLDHIRPREDKAITSVLQMFHNYGVHLACLFMSKVAIDDIKLILSLNATT